MDMVARDDGCDSRDGGGGGGVCEHGHISACS